MHIDLVQMEVGMLREKSICSQLSLLLPKFYPTVFPKKSHFILTVGMLGQIFYVIVKDFSNVLAMSSCFCFERTVCGKQLFRVMCDFSILCCCCLGVLVFWIDGWDVLSFLIAIFLYKDCG